MPFTSAYYPFKIRGEYPQVFIGAITPALITAADSKGFTVLGRGGPSRQMIILGCRSCGTPIHRRDRVILHHNIDCDGCIQNKDVAAAAVLGGELVSTEPMGHRHLRKWRLKCGHSPTGQHAQSRARR